MARRVEAEILDRLAAGDPVALRARRDLTRIHGAMATRSTLLRALRGWAPLRTDNAPWRLLELGAGDGSLMLGVAEALGPAWAPVELTLLDQQPAVAAQTLQRYADLGWQVTVEVADALEWAEEAGGGRAPVSPLPPVPPVPPVSPFPTLAPLAPLPSHPPSPLSGPRAADAPAPPPAPAACERTAARWDLIVANLFLHHFESAPLAALLRAVAQAGQRFLACEPRRSRFALAASHLVAALGVNAVTRHDAVLSVRAGFCADELACAWSAAAHSADIWRLLEGPAGLFGHCFHVERVGAGIGAGFGSALPAQASVNAALGPCHGRHV